MESANDEYEIQYEDVVHDYQGILIRELDRYT